MSLISEALRKARQETAEREAREQGLETPVVAGYWKRGGQLGFGLVLGAAIAMAAAVIGGGMVWWALADRSGAMMVEASAGDTPPGTEVVEAQQDPTSAGLVIDLPDEVKEPTVPPVEATSNNLDVPPAIEDSAGNGAEVINRTPDGGEGVSTEVPSPQPQTTLAEGKFVGEAQIGEVTLTLDYLVYRKENPFAQINGRDVRVGAVIEDYVVETITENSVVLSQGDTKIVLRVH